jgi:hypothetical protein
VYASLEEETALREVTSRKSALVFAGLDRLKKRPGECVTVLGNAAWQALAQLQPVGPNRLSTQELMLEMESWYHACLLATGAAWGG